MNMPKAITPHVLQIRPCSQRLHLSWPIIAHAGRGVATEELPATMMLLLLLLLLLHCKGIPASRHQVTRGGGFELCTQARAA